MVNTIRVNNSRKIKDLRIGDISQIPLEGRLKKVEFMGINPNTNTAVLLRIKDRSYQCINLPIQDGVMREHSSDSFTIVYQNVNKMGSNLSKWALAMIPYSYGRI